MRRAVDGKLCDWLNGGCLQVCEVDIQAHNGHKTDANHYDRLKSRTTVMAYTKLMKLSSRTNILGY